MALCYWNAHMLCTAARAGVDFKRVATIGHLDLYLHPQEIKKLQTAFPPRGTNPFTDYTFGDYSDDFLRHMLGTTSISVIDNSDYEGATILHDLNQPLPKKLHGQFDAVIEAGTLEHIFNVPVAITSLMNMVKLNGRLYLAVPANNLCGHGFYQFSPELMFRIFSAEYGFKVVNMLLSESTYPSIEITPQGAIYDVTDPAKVRQRVGLMSNNPITLLLEAEKIAEVDLSILNPMQSDYVAAWQGTNKVAPSLAKRAAKKVLTFAPDRIRRWVYGSWQKYTFSFANRRFYKKR